MRHFVVEYISIVARLLSTIYVVSDSHCFALSDQIGKQGLKFTRSEEVECTISLRFANYQGSPSFSCDVGPL